MARKYETEYKYYLRCYVDKNTALTNGSPTKEAAIASALAVYDKEQHGKPRTHQLFEEEMNRMIG